jgi:hypothetical protein
MSNNWPGRFGPGLSFVPNMLNSLAAKVLYSISRCSPASEPALSRFCILRRCAGILLPCKI